MFTFCRRHSAAFYGTELVTWLLEFGLATTRQEAESLGRHLVRGRVIRSGEFTDLLFFIPMVNMQKLRNTEIWNSSYTQYLQTAFIC